MLSCPKHRNNNYEALLKKILFQEWLSSPSRLLDISTLFIVLWSFVVELPHARQYFSHKEKIRFK